MFEPALALMQDSQLVVGNPVVRGCGHDIVQDLQGSFMPSQTDAGSGKVDPVPDGIWVELDGVLESAHGCGALVQAKKAAPPVEVDLRVSWILFRNPGIQDQCFLVMSLGVLLPGLLQQCLPGLDESRVIRGHDPGATAGKEAEGQDQADPQKMKPGGRT